MAKRQTFADKVQKKSHVEECKVCASPITPTMFVIPQATENGTIKYKKDIVKICKCNYKQYYG